MVCTKRKASAQGFQTDRPFVYTHYFNEHRSDQHLPVDTTNLTNQAIRDKFPKSTYETLFFNDDRKSRSISTWRSRDPIADQVIKRVPGPLRT